MVYSIIVPAYNEGQRLGFTLKVLKRLEPDVRIVVACDGCTDNTVEVARANGVDVVESPVRLGKGGALVHALDYVNTDKILFVDADLPVDLVSIKKVVGELDGYDLVLGSRTMQTSQIIRKSPVHRQVLGELFNLVLHKLFTLSVSDTQCGIKAFRKSRVEGIFQNLNVHGWLFDAELVLKAERQGLRVKEVGVNWSFKNHGKLNVIKQSWEMLLGLLALRLSMKGSRNFDYSGLKGDSYVKAGNSWFWPRRYWHEHKNRMVLDGVNGEWILDVGCGSGQILQKLVDKTAFGVDIGERFVSYCREHYPFAHVFKQDALNLGFSDGMFDDVICTEVLEHLADPDRALSEFRRVLKPRGRLILTTPRFSMRWLMIERLWGWVRRERLEGDHDSFSEPRLRQLLARHGFDVLTCKPFMVGCLLYAVAKKSS